MNLDRVEIKGRARWHMQTAEPRPLWVGAVFFLVGLLISYAAGRLSRGFLVIDTRLAMDPATVYEAMSIHPEVLTPFVRGLLAALNVINLLVTAGFQIYALRASRGETAGFADLLSGFDIFFRVLWLSILEYVLISLWTMLLIIPGIVAAYRYRQAFYLLVDHPEWSAWRCLRESGRMMRGHKMELFVMDLSFLGWNLLCVFQIVKIYVYPYVELSRAEFYNRLSGVAAPGGAGNTEEKPPWEY